MTKLKLDAIVDEKPVKLTLDIPAALHRDLLAYADYLISQRVSVDFSMGDSAWRT